MMEFLWCLMAFLVSAVAIKPSDVTEQELTAWDLFKVEYMKNYDSEKEEFVRRLIFVDNLRFIQEHNKKYVLGEVTFYVGVNRFADMSAAEFKAMMNGLRVPAGYNRTGDMFLAAEGVEVPPSVDWRKKGAVTPVKDQGQCGSCWAFSATGSLEGQNFIKTKKLVSLSEQNLVDCSNDEGNQGCNGGLMDQAFKYIKINRGIDTESSYPYQAEDEDCRYNPKNKGATDYGYVDVPKANERQLQAAVAQKGPISVGIDASHSSFQLYHGGVYKEPQCSSEELDHGVLAVGYGTAKTGGDFWLVKNSWGQDWGMQGYILMARNNRNMCGIASMASYPTV